MGKTLQRITDAKTQGSNVVVFLTGSNSVRGLLSEFGRFYEASALQPGDLVMVGLGSWAKDLAVVRGLEKIALGSLVFKEEHGKYNFIIFHSLSCIIFMDFFIKVSNVYYIAKRI